MQWSSITMHFIKNSIWSLWRTDEAQGRGVVGLAKGSQWAKWKENGRKGIRKNTEWLERMKELARRLKKMQMKTPNRIVIKLPPHSNVLLKYTKGKKTLSHKTKQRMNIIEVFWCARANASTQSEFPLKKPNQIINKLLSSLCCRRTGFASMKSFHFSLTVLWLAARGRRGTMDRRSNKLWHSQHTSWINSNE